jgi:PBSX family phage terminase large subunit
MTDPLSPKQLEFLIAPKTKWNMAHGAVRTGKTVGLTMAFLNDAAQCLDSDIYIVGHTFDTAYRNVIRLIMESPEFFLYRPFCTWSGKKLYFKDKVITVLGAKDEGAVGVFQGLTISLVLCDEMTLYPESIIDMIQTRLSRPYSRGYATMNPSHPSHKLKKWIDMGVAGDPNYYSMHFALEDNPFVDEDYKNRLRNSLSGVFYKRNYLGLWCMAEGAIFDFFDYKIHTVDRPPCAADYWIAGIDYGASNPFVCLLLGVSTGKYTQSGKQIWVEKEYYWDPKKTMRQKVNSEYAADLQTFLGDYDVKQIYIDPSAASMKAELRKCGINPTDANNDVEYGIQTMTSEMQRGNVKIVRGCANTIREIETYVWDPKASEKGFDEPYKRADHCCDALRYCLATHQVIEYDPYKEAKARSEWMKTKYTPTRNM